jgi:hypothetical protein
MAGKAKHPSPSDCNLLGPGPTGKATTAPVKPQMSAPTHPQPKKSAPAASFTTHPLAGDGILLGGTGQRAGGKSAPSKAPQPQDAGAGGLLLGGGGDVLPLEPQGNKVVSGALKDVPPCKSVFEVLIDKQLDTFRDVLKACLHSHVLGLLFFFRMLHSTNRNDVYAHATYHWLKACLLHLMALWAQLCQVLLCLPLIMSEEG